MLASMTQIKEDMKEELKEELKEEFKEQDSAKPLILEISDEARKAYPGIIAGYMIVNSLGIAFQERNFTSLKHDAIKDLRIQYQNYERNEFITSEPTLNYKNYYKKYNKTYPVLQQLESILLKGKELPDAGIFVEAMFLSEIQNMLLTAGHDYEHITFPLKLDIAEGGEAFLGIGEREQFMTKGDLFLSDKKGILSSILNGPDHRTKIKPDTKSVLYFVYGVQGVNRQQIQQHLNQIKQYIKVYAPGSEIGDVNVL